MLINKYENIYCSLPKIAYDIILKLEKRPYKPIDLYFAFNKKIGINKFYDVLTFLFITDIIKLEMNHLRLVNEVN